jgi:hypothetical protein
MLMNPPATWYEDCHIYWDYDAPVAKWIPLSETLSSEQECESRYAEMARREAAHKPGALAHAQELEARESRIAKFLGPIFFDMDASTSDVCRALADEWAHARCKYVDGVQPPSSTSAEPHAGSR